MSLGKIDFGERTVVEITESGQGARLDGDTRFSLIGKSKEALALACELLPSASIDMARYYARIVKASCKVDNGFSEDIESLSLELEVSPVGDGPFRHLVVPDSQKTKEAKRLESFKCNSLLTPNLYQAWRGGEPTCAKTNEPCPVVLQVDKLIKAATN